MTDHRNEKLADILVNYSIKAKPNEKIVVRLTNPIGLPLARRYIKDMLILATRAQQNIFLILPTILNSTQNQR